MLLHSIFKEARFLPKILTPIDWTLILVISAPQIFMHSCPLTFSRSVIPLSVSEEINSETDGPLQIKSLELKLSSILSTLSTTEDKIEEETATCES